MKIELEYNPLTGNVTINNSPFYLRTGLEHLEVKDRSKSDVEAMIQLKNSGFEPGHIIEIAKAGLL